MRLERGFFVFYLSGKPPLAEYVERAEEIFSTLCEGIYRVGYRISVERTKYVSMKEFLRRNDGEFSFGELGFFELIAKSFKSGPTQKFDDTPISLILMQREHDVFCVLRYKHTAFEFLSDDTKRNIFNSLASIDQVLYGFEFYKSGIAANKLFNIFHYLRGAPPLSKDDKMTEEMASELIKYSNIINPCELLMYNGYVRNIYPTNLLNTNHISNLRKEGKLDELVDLSFEFLEVSKGKIILRFKDQNIRKAFDILKNIERALYCNPQIRIWKS